VGEAVLVVANSRANSPIPGLLRGRGYRCVVTTSIGQATETLATRDFAFTLVDLRTDPESADLLPALRLQPGRSGPIVGISGTMSGTDSEPDAEPGILGVDHVIRRSQTAEEFDHLLRLITSAPAPAEAVPAGLPESTLAQEIALWRSPSMRDVRAIIEEAASVDVTVLITGETGTGKDVAARAIHYLSPQAHGPFVKVNCAAMPRELLESELFGHERGAFTGAYKLKIGKFELAHRGSLYLDEIGDLHPALQAKLLHVLQDGSFSRVGGKTALKADVRVLAATNQDLERAVAEGRFREDLYYRLNVIQITIPPLRERPEDIPALVEYFVKHYSHAFHREGFSLPESVLQQFLRHRYPGNVRELENLIKRMIVLRDPYLLRSIPRNGVTPQPAAPGQGEETQVSLREVVRRASLSAEREAITRVLEQNGWNRTRTAKAFKISYRGLLYKMKRVGLKGVRPPSRPTGWDLRKTLGGWPA
jgi:two-component system response regulator AtoC